MQIRAEQFNQIVEDCARQRSDGRTDKRRTARAGVRYTATVRPMIPNTTVAAAPFTARLREIGGRGVGLTCPTPLAGVFTLEMPDGQDVAQVVKCRVIHCRRVEGDQYLVGAAFVE